MQRPDQTDGKGDVNAEWPHVDAAAGVIERRQRVNDRHSHSRFNHGADRCGAMGFHYQTAVDSFLTEQRIQ
ncbi:hypothetical protein D3C81_2084540 [compost metagenome]